jgi:hypothetical protein
VLLVDDDEAEVAERQEQRRARAHDELRLPLPQHPPCPPPLGHGDARVPLGGLRAEARLHPRQELRRQRDLGQEDERLPPRADALGHRLEIDLRLA